MSLSRAVPAWPVLIALPLLGACPGSIDLESATGPHVIPGLGTTDCTPLWEGETLPAEVVAAMEDELTAAVSELKDAIQTEAGLKGTGPLTGAKLLRLRLALTPPPAAPDSQNTLGFVRSLALHVRPADPGSTLPVLLLARVDAVDAEATAVDLAPTDVDLWPYLKAGLRITVTAPPRTCLRDDLTLSLEYTARIFF